MNVVFEHVLAFKSIVKESVWYLSHWRFTTAWDFELVLASLQPYYFSMSLIFPISHEAYFRWQKCLFPVLIDPHKRAIYDTTGVKGLETEGWEVSQRTRTPEEIREEFERLARWENRSSSRQCPFYCIYKISFCIRINRELALDQATKPKGTVFMRINATDLFSDYGTTTEWVQKIAKVVNR